MLSVYLKFLGIDAAQKKKINVFKCAICSRTFPTKKARNRHKNKHKKNKFGKVNQCRFCLKCSENKRDYDIKNNELQNKNNILKTENANLANVNVSLLEKINSLEKQSALKNAKFVVIFFK